MAADFDPDDRNSWYFGVLSRDDANNILQAERDSGVFLVRDSTTIRGDFVLCVKEDAKVSHYIINKIQVGGMTRFRIGDQEFPDLPSLLTFYKTHYLDTTSLIRPAPREKYVGKYDFAGRDPEDLAFKKGEVLTILQKDEDQWWTAKNNDGQTGSVPVPYLQKYDADQHQTTRKSNAPLPSGAPLSTPAPAGIPLNVQNGQKKLPALARVTRQRIACAYDSAALNLEVGETITVTEMHINGQWKGEVTRSGKKYEGSFPFTHVEFIDGNEGDQ